MLGRKVCIVWSSQHTWDVISDHGLCSSFWTNTRFLGSANHYIPQISVLQTFSKTQNPSERNKISRLRGNPRECDEADARYPKEVVLGMLTSVETALDKMAGLRMRLLRRLNTELICRSFLIRGPAPRFLLSELVHKHKSDMSIYLLKYIDKISSPTVALFIA